MQAGYSSRILFLCCLLLSGHFYLLDHYSEVPYSRKPWLVLPSWLAQVFPLGSHGSAGFPYPRPDCAVSLTGLGAAIGYAASHVFISESSSPPVLRELDAKKEESIVFCLLLCASTSRSSLLMIID